MRRTVVALALAIATLCLSAAPKAAAVAHETLPNGLETFVAENHSVPLVTVCVAFRGGASAQDRGTAGLFHLYEHMLFKSNAKYPNQAAFVAALNRMGVASWNGATGGQFIEYYITIPSEKLDEGLEFWSWAVKSPRFDPKELESEKAVVINEIRGYHADPDQIMQDALETRLFPGAPWRKNVDGPEANIEAATAEGLEAMRAAFYIPKNAALFIGGDVKPERAFAAAKKWFGDWAGGAAPTIGEPPQGPIPEGIRLVYADPDYYDGVGQVQLRWRGPDVLRQTKDSYVADVLTFLLSSPVGAFKSALMEKGPGLYDPEYISFGYPTERDGGEFDFGAFLTLKDPAAEGPTLDRVEKLRAALRAELEAIAADPASYFGPGELEKAKAKLVDQNLLAAEVASSFATDTLAYWWAVATTDYYFGYEGNCRSVTWADISSLVRRYLLGAPSASALRLSQAAYEADPTMGERMRDLKCQAVSGDNAFWWQQP
jgi:zinc protease